MIGWKGPLAWMAAGAALWLTAGLIDRTTEVEIYSDGRRIHLSVAGTDLSVPLAVDSISGVEIEAMDSIAPPGGREITIAMAPGEGLKETLPDRFIFPTGGLVPVGDWEIDERAAQGIVWRRMIDFESPWTLRTLLTGRFQHDVSFRFQGKPGFEIALRRGLINNDCFIRSHDGTTLAATSIDPTPAADLGAIGATILRAAAVATLLIALSCVLGGFTIDRLRATLSGRSPITALAVTVAIFAAALSGWLAADVFEKLPHQPDSATYLLQAEWLLDGQLWQDVSPIQDRLAVPYTYVVDDRWLAHYPPMWPAVLALGLALGAPWIVAPLLGGIYTLLLYLVGREIDGPELGLVAAALGLVSPVARLIFGSMLSHAAAATMLLAAIWLVLFALRRQNPGLALLAGIAVGLGFGIRPLSALAVALPLAGFVAFDGAHSVNGRRNRGLFLGFAGGGLAAAVPTLISNHLITGSWFAFPYALHQQSMYTAANLPFGIRNLDAQLATTANSIFGWGWQWVHGVVPAALALSFALVPLLRRRQRPADRLLLAIVVIVLVAHVFLRGHGLHGFGPRYHFEAFAALYLLTARGVFELARSGRNGPSGIGLVPMLAFISLFFVLCLPAGAILPQRLGLYRGYNGVDGGLKQQIEATRATEAVILLPADDWRGWATAVRMDGADPVAPILFIEGDPLDPEIFEIAGDRPVFRWDGWRLTPVAR